MNSEIFILLILETRASLYTYEEGKISSIFWFIPKILEFSDWKTQKTQGFQIYKYEKKTPLRTSKLLSSYQVTWDQELEHPGGKQSVKSDQQM